MLGQVVAVEADVHCADGYLDARRLADAVADALRQRHPARAHADEVHVASLAIDMLAGKGYAVTAVTGKDSEHEFLKKLGAQEILARGAIDFGTRPLEKSLWAAAFDSVGGEQLGWLTRTMNQSGLIAAFGNAGGIDLKTNVLPFILRGVRLMGVDSVSTPMPLRRKVWQRLATELKPRHLADIANVISMDDLTAYFDKMLKGSIRGRAVVRLS